MRLNNSGSTLASSYTAGAGTLTVVDGTQFGTPSGGDPLRITVYTVNPLLYTVYLCTGVATNTLTIGTAQEGTTDRNYATGAFVQNLITAGDLNGLDTRITSNTTNISTNTTNISTNTSNISTNTSGISTLTTAVNGANGKLLGGNTGGTPVGVTVGSGLSLSAGTLTASGGGGGTAIGGAVTSGTSGSILFVDGSTDLAQDNTHLYYDPSTVSLSVGGHAPGGFSFPLWVANASNALIGFGATGAGTDEKNWYIDADSGGQLTFSTWNDALNVGRSFSAINRSGYNITNWNVDCQFVLRGTVFSTPVRPTTSVVLIVEQVTSQTADLVNYTTPLAASVLSGVDVNGCYYPPSGATGSRPTVGHVGCEYYDSTLHKPVYWDGSNWRDAMANIV